MSLNVQGGTGNVVCRIKSAPQAQGPAGGAGQIIEHNYYATKRSSASFLPVPESLNSSKLGRSMHRIWCSSVRRLRQSNSVIAIAAERRARRRLQYHERGLRVRDAGIGAAAATRNNLTSYH